MDVPEGLIKEIERENCIIFVGLGLSRPELPDWKGLLTEMIDWGANNGVSLTPDERTELEKLIKENKLLLVAEEMRERMGDNGFHKFMLETFRDKKLQPKNTHRLITQIPFKAIITTNYDVLLESAYTPKPPVFTHSNEASQSQYLHREDFYIFKAHGDIDDIKTVILGRRDYRELLKNSAYNDHLKAVFATKIVLFIGYSLTDYDMILLLDDLSTTFKGYTVRHYALIYGKEVSRIERNRFLKDYNIQIIPYDSPNHSDVEAFLTELANPDHKKPEENTPSSSNTDISPLIKLSRIPELPAHFLQRSEHLDKIKGLVLEDVPKPVVVTGKTTKIGVHGMGGIGKSVLASAVANDPDVNKAFPDGIIWITVGQEPEKTSNQWRQIVEMGDQLGKMLENKTCLLILDDIWKAEHVGKIGTLGKQCKMLITTRDAGIVNALGAKEHRIDVLNESNALNLLADWSDKPLESLPAVAREVAKECGYLPLALAMIGAMVHGESEDYWDNVLHKLKNADLDKIKQEFPDYPYPNMLKAIQVSVDALEPEQRKCYLDFAVFPEDTLIPEAVLETFWKPQKLNKYDVQDMSILLVKRSLLRRDDKTKYLSLHDLQYDYVRKQIPDMKALHNRFLDAYRAKYKDGWHSGPDDGYFFQHLAYHLMQAERKDELRGLLLDYRWLRAKLDVTDTNFLIADYSFLSDDLDMQMIQNAIRLSSNSLSRNKSHLAGQLIGRLMSYESDDAQAMLKQVGQCCKKWICPMKPTLTPPGGPLIRTLEGHSDWVRSVAITPDGRKVVSASSDSTLKVWDIDSGMEIRTLEGHSSSVYSVAITPDGRKVVSASSDKTLKVWDIDSGMEIRTLVGHSSLVNSVAITPDGRKVVSASYDNTLKIWDIETGELIASFCGDSPLLCCAVSPDGITIVAGEQSGVVHFLRLMGV